MGKWLVLALVTLVAIVGRAADNSDRASQQRRHGNRRAQPSAIIAGNVTINELDTDTHEGVNDTAEFIELYDGGVGNHDLSGLTLVLYRGDESVVYLAESLDGEATDALGYYMIGAVGMPGVDFSLAIGTIRDDQGAVAIYAAPEGQFPINSPVTTEDLVDALVYDQQGGEEPSAELMSLLLAGQAPLYEDTGGSALTHSSQRCPEGESPRTTELFILNIPTPDGTNNCVVDVAPEVVSVFPAPNAADVATDVEITVSFSEPVTLGAVPLEVVCTESDLHDYTVTGSDSSYQFSLETPLLPGESCVATIFGEEVSDTDVLDPPDHLEESSYSWQFSVAAVIADWIVINELDTDTPGVDTAEFIELYDGGSGTTPLTGLVMVLYNGDTDMSYSVMDLAGFETNNDGYFVAGNASLVPDLVFSDAKLQNGTDAVAIYSGSTSDFPNGTPVTTEDLIDAVVYGIPNDASDELLALLVDGQLPADEDGQGNVVNDSLQRCPNGDGGQRFTEPFQAGSPTPGSSNECPEDAAPFVAEVSPARDALNVPLNATIVVSFSEGVSVEDNWIEVDCLQSGQMTASHDMGPITYTLSMSMPFSANDSCEVTVFSAMVRDLDSEDPPDTMAADDVWAFETAAEAQPVVAGFTSNGSIWVDQAAVFTNTSTGPAPLEFNWDFGDGSPVSNEVNPTHFYPAPGSYIVELTATSGSLSDIYSQTMVVLNATAFLPAVLGATESPDSSPNSRSNLAIRRH